MKIYKITEASKYLGISINSLKTLANNGKLNSFKTGGEHRRFREDDLDAYMGVKKEKQERLIKGERGYSRETQTGKNLAWYLPRPKPDYYKGGMPLYAEDWLVQLAEDILGKRDLEILNVFCGMNTYGLRVDINPKVKPEILCDVHELTKHIKGKEFDFIFADPPYSTEESRDLYGTPPIHYKKWTAECDKLLRKGGLLCVYHKYVMPNPDPTKYVVEKRVFIGNRTYHLPRVAIYFKKKMKKVKEIYYIDNREERASDFSTGFVFILEDGSKVETMTTDPIAERYTKKSCKLALCNEHKDMRCEECKKL